MTRKDYLQTARDLKRELVSILKNEKYRGGTMICSHNTILCIKNTDTNKIEFIIDNDTDRGMKMLHEVGQYISVPRYEPSVAKKWLKEPLSFNTSNLSFDDEEFHKEWASKRVKYTCGEDELKQAYKEQLRERIDMNQMFAKVMKDNDLVDL